MNANEYADFQDDVAKRIKAFEDVYPTRSQAKETFAWAERRLLDCKKIVESTPFSEIPVERRNNYEKLLARLDASIKKAEASKGVRAEEVPPPSVAPTADGTGWEHAKPVEAKLADEPEQDVETTPPKKNGVASLDRFETIPSRLEIATRIYSGMIASGSAANESNVDDRRRYIKGAIERANLLIQMEAESPSAL